MAEKPVCVNMNGDTKVAIQGSTTGPKQRKLSSPGSTVAIDQETTKTLTEINQEDCISVNELDGNASEVLRIQNGRLICENPSNITTVVSTGELPLSPPQQQQTEPQLLDFNNQNTDATVNVSIDSGFLDGSSTPILPVLSSRTDQEESITCNNVVCDCEDLDDAAVQQQAHVQRITNPEVPGTNNSTDDTCIFQIHNNNITNADGQCTVVLEASGDIPFRIDSDKTEIREGDAVNVINIPETGENVSAGFALVSDLISSAEDLVAITNSDPSSGVAPVVVADGLQTTQIIQVGETGADQTSTNSVQILNPSVVAPLLESPAVATSIANPVTMVNLGTANSTSGNLQLDVSSLNQVAQQETLTTGSTPTVGQPIVYMVTSRDKTTGLMQRFRVTVDPESITHLPIGAINLGSALPGLAIGSGGQIIQTADQNHVGSDGLMTGDSSAIAGTIVNSGSGGSIDQTSHNVPPVSVQNETAVAAANLGLTSIIPSQIQQEKSKVDLFSCPEEGCHAAFTQRTKLKLHQLTHANDRPYKCVHDGCQWAFQTLYKLRRHEAGHSGLKPYLCNHEGCRKTFSTIYNLNIHMKLHQNLEYVICEVKGCGEVFPSKVKLEIHQRKHFEDKQIKCHFPGCGKSFTTSSAFGSHQRIHQREEQMYKCPVEGCDKIYDKACRLKLHHRSHTGERPFKCTFEGCKWAFTCQQKLSRHMVRHTGDRKYQCQFEGCNKLFTRLEHLKGHRVSHSGEKPYACSEPDCNARFSARSSLYMHVKRHKQGKPMREKLLFSCPFDTCTKSFNTKQGLKNHMVKEHCIQLPSSLSGEPENPGNAMDMVYIPTESIQMALEQFGDIGGTATTTSTTKTVVHIREAVSSMGPDGDAPSAEPILQQAALAAEKSMEAAASLNPDFLTASQTASSSASIVTAGGLVNDVPAVFATTTTTTQLPQQDKTGAPSQTNLLGPSKVHQKNHSGSARTDFMYKVGGVKRPPSLDDGFDSDHSDGGFVCSAYAPTTFTMTTSASLMLRDPTTGARFVQSQLLQDDPPDENDMVFSLTPPPSSSDQSPLATDLAVSSILPGAETPGGQSADFLQSESTSGIMEGFRESTINLQDLE